MNEKTEKDGTGKLQSSAGIAKQRVALPRLAHRHLQTLIVPPEPSLLRPAAALVQRQPCTPCFTRSAYIGMHRGSPILFSLQEPCTILTIVPQSAGFHPTETVCKRSLSGRFRMGRQNFCSVSPCF